MKGGHKALPYIYIKKPHTFVCGLSVGIIDLSRVGQVLSRRPEQSGGLFQA